MDYKKLGLFKIEKKINNVTFRLALPPTMKIFNTFHISLLEPTPKNIRGNPNSYTPEVEEENNDTTNIEISYEVKKILDLRKDKNGQLEYRIKWTGYSNKYNTWEPKSRMSCYRLIRRFYEQNPRKPR